MGCAPAPRWLLCSSQDSVLSVISQIMDECIPQERAPRDFCVKFPEEIRHDNLAGQLWFGAEVVTWAWDPKADVGVSLGLT